MDGTNKKGDYKMLTQQEYEEKREARYNRLLKAASKAAEDSAALREQSRRMSDCIPFGQPILIGHHSESRDRNFRDRIQNKMRKGYELAQKAEEYRSRAASIESNDAIYSDNPQAVDLLTEKIARLKARQELMKATNKAIKKNDRAALIALGHAESIVNRWLDPEPMPWPGRGYAAFELTNNNANIKTAEKRAALVEKKQSIPDKDEDINGVKIEFRAGENRIRVDFGKRVSLDVYKSLKSHGYRAMKEEGVFSAYYNWNAGEFIKELRSQK